MTQPQAKSLTPLTAKQLAAYRLRYDEELTYGEMADRLRISRNAVKCRLQSAETKMADRKNLPVPKPKSQGERVAELLRKLKAHDFTRGDTALVEVLDETIVSLVLSMDKEAQIQASLSQKAQAFGVLVDRRQLLKGQPTAIVRYEDIRKIDELAVAIKDEIERRQKLVDVTPTVEG